MVPFPIPDWLIVQRSPPYRLRRHHRRMKIGAWSHFRGGNALAHYLKALQFADRLFQLRHAGSFKFLMGDIPVIVTPLQELLDGDVLDLKFSGDGLKAMRVDLAIGQPTTVTHTHLFISAGPWGYGNKPEVSYYLFVHDDRRRKSHQIDLLTQLVEDPTDDGMVLRSQLRFPFKGGREARLRLTKWLLMCGIDYLNGYFVIGTEEDMKKVLQNLITIGLLKQHIRGYKVITSLLDLLPPRL